MGYGQQESDLTTMTNTMPGAISGKHSNWLRTTAEMLLGHSGGPVVNSDGSVVGWCVRSEADDGVATGGIHSIRPIEEAVNELAKAGF